MVVVSVAGQVRRWGLRSLARYLIATILVIGYPGASPRSPPRQTDSLPGLSTRQSRDQAGEDLFPALIGEQDPGQQHMDHHPQGQPPHPAFLAARHLQSGINHLKQDDAGRFAQMPGANTPEHD